MTYGGNFPNRTPLDDEPADIDDIERLILDMALEAEQDAHEATLEAESDTHTVLRHTEFYPLDIDTRGWTIAEVDAALGLRDQAAIEQRAQEFASNTLGQRVL